jgi:FkbM family methyltransferase
VIEHQGVFLPDGETHLVDWMSRAGEIVGGKGTYQIKKLRAAMALCRNFRTAVDVGAHVGLWSMQLVKHFGRVHAFEPVSAHRWCFVRNLEGSMYDGEPFHGSAILHDCALGAAPGFVRMQTAPTSSGDTKVGGDGDVPMLTLDSFELFDVDFIKIDCEGYELNVLAGAAQTIAESRPVVCVEQKPGHGQQFGFREQEAVEWLVERGYKVAKVMSGDFICVPS